MLGRVGLALVAAAQAEIGIWGELAPRGFFDDFPAIAGQHWVRMLGPYNEHLLRDFAAAELGFAVLLLAAAIWFERRLVLVAGAAFLVFTVPHVIYHLTTTDAMPAAGNALSLGSFALELAVVAAVTARIAHAPAPASASASASAPAPTRTTERSS
jgi:hypothetical protein